MNKGTEKWVMGLLAALIGGAAGAAQTSLGVLVIAPEKFAIGPVLWKTLITIGVLAVLSGLQMAFAYLKQSPVPTETVEITATQTATVTSTPSDEKK